MVSWGPPESTLDWALGLASHWQWVYLVVGLLGAAAALSRRRWHTLLPAAMVIVSWLHVTPAAPMAAAGDQGTVLSVASANLNYEVTDHRALVSWLTSPGAPDVVILLEFTPSAMAAVEDASVQSAYPDRLHEVGVDQFGIALLSRRPFRSPGEVVRGEGLSTTKLRAMLDVDGKSVAVTAVHPMPPVSAIYAKERDRSLAEEAARIAAGGAPGVIAGDMNDTPWSSGLRAAQPLQLATGITGTWPNAWGWLSLLPLDHVLVTPGIQVTRRDASPDLGSDHLPVVVRLRI